MSVSYAQLKAFHAVAMNGSFTRAADHLCLSQPAVSDQVRKLEDYYGVMVFHRNKRSVGLTDVGERLFELTRRLFDISADAHELLMDYRGLTTGSLNLAVDAPVHMLPHVARFCARYPGVEVKIETGNTDEVLERLFAHRVDFALLGQYVDDDRLSRLQLSSDPMIAFVAHDHPWAQRGSINLAELDDIPLVLREPGSVTRLALEEEMAAANLRIRKAIEVEGREAAREAVAYGIGVGIISAAELGCDPRVCAIPIRDCQRRFTETLVCLRSHSSRRIVSTFMDMTREGLLGSARSGQEKRRL
jgi:aminoethylphosphonate catabolism LysR family transcriptional regulator